MILKQVLAQTMKAMAANWCPRNWLDKKQPRKTFRMAKMDGMLSVRINSDTGHVESNLVT